MGTDTLLRKFDFKTFICTDEESFETRGVYPVGIVGTVGFSHGR